MSAEENIVQAAEAIVAKFPTLPSGAGNSPKKGQITDDELYGQMIAKKLGKLPEREEKESLKLNIQVLIRDVMFAKSSQWIQQQLPTYQHYGPSGTQNTYQNMS